MGPNPAEKGTNSGESFLNRPLSRRGLVIAAGTAAAASPFLPFLYRLIPNRPPVVEAAEVKPTGVEVSSVASSFASVAFVYKAEDGKNYPAIAGLKDGKVEATRLLTPIENPQSIGISKDGKTVAVGGADGKVGISSDGGNTWRTHTLPPEYEFVTGAIPVETIDQNPNRPVCVVGQNPKTGRGGVFLIYPADGSIIPVTGQDFGGISPSIQEEGGEYVYLEVNPKAYYYKRYAMKRTGDTATVNKTIVPLASGVKVDTVGFEIFDKGQRKLWISNNVQYEKGDEGGVFIKPTEDTTNFTASRALFHELARASFHLIELAGVTKLDDSNEAYAVGRAGYTELPDSPMRQFFAFIVTFDSTTGKFIQRIPIELPADASIGLNSNGMIFQPAILQKGTDKIMKVIWWKNGVEKVLTAPLNNTNMVFQHLPDVKVLQAPATKVVIPVVLNAVTN